MRFESEYCVLELESDNVVNKFHVGDEATIKLQNGLGMTGRISLVTVKGIYLATGSKKDKYFRLDEIAEIDKREVR